MIIPVILCGGYGTRLWPASSKNRPKQLLPLAGGNSLLQDTLLRAMRTADCGAADCVTVTAHDLADEISRELFNIDPAAVKHLLRESEARGTAAAVAVAAAYVEKTFGPDALMWVLPSDHHIKNEEELKRALQAATVSARVGNLVTFGIRPTRPETGYGYILPGAQGKATAFVEKPDAATAEIYVSEGYLWNSGMFVFTAAAILSEYKLHAAGEASFDKAVMEKSQRVSVVPCDPQWSDVGSWESLWELRQKDGDGNVIEGNAVCEDTRNCLIRAGGRMIAVAGVENLVIVESNGVLLITKRGDDNALRALAETVGKKECATR